MPALSPYDDEKPDFKSRYPASTVGMTPAQATVATTNSNAEDASIAKVNAVARLNPAQVPGTTFSTPVNDATQLDAAAGMDRADLFDRGLTQTGPSLSELHTDNISQRRADIAGQINTIKATLGIIPPREAGLAGVVTPGHDKYGLAKRAELLQQWHALEGEDSNLLHEHQNVAIDTARSDHENFTRQLHIQSANGLSKILSGIADIKDPMGSDEHTSAVMKILASNDPDIAAARGAPGFEKLISPYAEQAKKSAERKAMLADTANQPADQYYSIEALHKDNPGAEYRQDPKTGGYYVALGGKGAKPNAAYVKQAAAVAEMQAKKDAAYNKNPKADLTSHDKDLAIEQAKLGAMKEALGMNDAPAAPSATPAPSASATPTAIAPTKRFVFNPTTKKLEPAKE